MVGASTEKKYGKLVNLYGNTDSNPCDIVASLKRENLSIDYIKTVLSALKWNASANNAHQDIIFNYRDEIKKLTAEQNKREKYVNKFEKVDWNNIKKISGHSVDDLIIGLYTLFPPRRIIDYAHMVFVDDIEDANNANENYYVKDDGLFIFQYYKSSFKYGVQKFDVPELLNELIREYAINNNIINGDPLIKYRRYGKNENKFNKRYLNKKLNDIFGTSVDGLRHSYITWLYRNPNNLFNIVDTSKKMGHNIRTHLNYLDKENIPKS